MTPPRPPATDAAAALPPGAAPRPTQRLLLLGVGYACLGLAAVGAVLPVMPTTVFLIAAAWAFGRASPALRARLLNDPRIGPTLRDWQQHRRISPRAKRAAVLAMAASWAAVTLVFRDAVASAASGLCMAGISAWLVTRPSAPPVLRPDAP